MYDKMEKIQAKETCDQISKRSSKASDFVELALKRSQLQNVTDNRKYRKNVANDKAE